MRKKYIISGGCSYTIHLGQYKELAGFDPKKHDIQFIGVGQNGASIHYITQSVIHVVSCLLKSGVAPQDIFVFVDYTQIGRVSQRIPTDFYDDFNKHIETLEEKHKYGTPQVVNELLSIYQWAGWTKINETVYSLMQNTLDHKFPKYFKDWDTNIRKSYREPIGIMEEYFGLIILFQSYLSSVGVDHRSFFMNNVIEGWYYTENNILKHKYTVYDVYEVPDLSDTLHVKQLSPILDAIFDTIDLSKIILYKKEGNNYGGIDEYVIDNFPKEYFVDINTGQGYGCIGPVYGMHPNNEVHRHYFTTFLKDTIESFINNEVHN